MFISFELLPFVCVRPELTRQENCSDGSFSFHGLKNDINMSQESCLSYSTLPSQTNDYDEEFLEELHEVDELYVVVNEQETENSDGDDDSDRYDTNYESDEDDHVYVEPSDTDNIEYITQNRFQNETCGCKEFYDGKPCSDIIDFDSAIEFREHCKELSKEELDVVIKVELFFPQTYRVPY